MLSYVISLTLLTLAVIIVRAVFKNKMSSRLVYALWLAVLIRMVLPFDLISIDRVGVDYIGTIESAVGHEIVLSAGDKSENTKPQTAKPE
jgi:beta-lactamase regulating signal transducer with metallopeptidase domain